MSSRGIDFDSFLEWEESIAGKPGGFPTDRRSGLLRTRIKWVTVDNSAILSVSAILLALFFGIFGVPLESWILPDGFFELAVKAEAEGAGSMIVSTSFNDLSIQQSLS